MGNNQPTTDQPTSKQFLGFTLPEGFERTHGAPPDMTLYRDGAAAASVARNQYLQHLAEFDGLLTPEDLEHIAQPLAVLADELKLGELVPFVNWHRPDLIARYQGVNRPHEDDDVRRLFIAIPDFQIVEFPYREPRPWIIERGLAALADPDNYRMAMQSDLINAGIGVANVHPSLPEELKRKNAELLAKLAEATGARLDLQ